VNKPNNFSIRDHAVTLIEMLVVLLIISILATVATGVYTGEARRARIAATQDLIRQLELGITRYEVDLGVFPPSGSGTTLTPPALPGDAGRVNGSGYLHIALVHSLSGNALIPASSAWRGPYVTVRANQVKPPNATSTSITEANILDAFGNPMLYVRQSDYAFVTGNFAGGSQLFTSAAPAGANTEFPAPNPFVSLGETYYNPSTYQITSFGPDANTIGTLANPPSGANNFVGAGLDDISNFGE
jgi:prepilin-type N-terminal cleavage/methylation domain-containing protein